MSSKSKDVLAVIGKKKGYEFFTHEHDVVKYSNSFKDINERIEYLQWTLNVYYSSNSINFQPNFKFYYENGIAKDQFADYLNIEINVLREFLEKMKKVKSDLEKDEIQPESSNINGKLKKWPYSFDDLARNIKLIQDDFNYKRDYIDKKIMENYMISKKQLNNAMDRIGRKGETVDEIKKSNVIYELEHLFT